MTICGISKGEGSPPHTWRILLDSMSRNWEERITSTHVENTGFDSLGFDSLEDHLHTRGEYTQFATLVTYMSGSPPHTWRILNKSSLEES